MLAAGPKLKIRSRDFSLRLWGLIAGTTAKMGGGSGQKADPLNQAIGTSFIYDFDAFLAGTL